MPSPFGEGQTDTPINRHNRGEVPPIFHQAPGLGDLMNKPLSRLPHGGEAQTILQQNIDLENHRPHQPRTEADSMPSPFGEGQTDTPINRHNRGEVPRIFHQAPGLGDLNYSQRLSWQPL